MPEDTARLMRSVISLFSVTSRFDKLEGEITVREGYALYAMAELGPGEGAIVEIGPHRGKATCYLAAGARAGNRGVVTAVDHFGARAGDPGTEGAGAQGTGKPGDLARSLELTLAAMDLDDRVDVVRGESTAVARGWRKPVRLLFIDGDHSHEGTRADFAAWDPHVVRGGLIVFHHLGRIDGVTSFYRDFVRTRGTEYTPIMTVETLSAVQKGGRG
jgi:predicted O-methyltransferase YrrM